MSAVRTTLITGANSGLGFEAARQLLTRDHERVILTARSQEKAANARNALSEQTGATLDRIETVLLDLMDRTSVEHAITQLEQRGSKLEGVILNAGGIAPLVDGSFARTEEGYTSMFAMNVGGHGQLLHGLLDAGLLAKGASVVFSSSEAARGIPAMGAAAATVPELPGSLDERLAAAARGEHLSGKPDSMAEYGLVKMIGTGWMAQLHKEYGGEYSFYAISPGASAGTAGTKSMPVVMGFVMKYLMFPAFKLMGRAHHKDVGAARYLQGIDGEGVESGKFYASPYPQMSGDLVEQDPAHQPLVGDAAFEAAAGRLVSGLASRLRVVA